MNECPIRGLVLVVRLVFSPALVAMAATLSAELQHRVFDTIYSMSGWYRAM